MRASTAVMTMGDYCKNNNTETAEIDSRLKRIHAVCVGQLIGFLSEEDAGERLAEETDYLMQEFLEAIDMPALSRWTSRQKNSHMIEFFEQNFSGNEEFYLKYSAAMLQVGFVLIDYKKSGKAMDSNTMEGILYNLLSDLIVEQIYG